MSDEDDDLVQQLGSCCMCETTVGVVNILMLPNRGLVPDHGWGCVQCNLPAHGAVAVLCDQCILRYTNEDEPLRFFCRGYPAVDGRAPIAELPAEPFDHDPSKHV
jgi:hypothetical protein